jgi:hypothetical protein
MNKRPCKLDKLPYFILEVWLQNLLVGKPSNSQIMSSPTDVAHEPARNSKRAQFQQVDIRMVLVNPLRCHLELVLHPPHILSSAFRFWLSWPELFYKVFGSDEIS